MDNLIEEKSFNFSVRIVNLCKYLNNNHKEYTISKQVLKSGTSIGANVAEAEQAQSNNDFISKMNIALKETAETKYWLKLLHCTDYINEDEYLSIVSDCIEIEKMLVSIVKTSKQKNDS